MSTDASVAHATIEAVLKAMGWERQRIPGTSRIRIAPDTCGVCGEPAREFDVLLGIPVCSLTCQRLAS
jgi:hypothetical protein